MIAQVVQITERRNGAQLTEDLASGSTILPLDDSTDLELDGGQVELGGNVYGYTVDTDDIVTLDTPTTTDQLADDWVYQYPPSVEREAHVQPVDQQEAVECRVPHSLWDKLPVGIRGPEDDAETVLCDVGEDGVVIVDVLGQEPLMDGAYIDPDSEFPTAPTSDGDPPGVSPTPTLQGGYGTIFVRWVPVTNSDPVTYEVYASDVEGFTVDDDSFAGEIRGSFFALRALPDDTPLEADTTYYVRIVARDADGAAAAGPEVSGAPEYVPAADVATDGEAPAASPTPVLDSGIGILVARWAPADNPDPVRYEVHVAATDDFAVSGGTKLGETSGASYVIRKTGAGATLAKGTTYYVKLVAKDADGSAGPSAQASAALTDLPSTDISGTLTDDQIEALSAAKLLGTISDAQIADLAAAKITGTLDDDQIAELSASKILGTLVDAQIASLAAAKITGQLADDQIEEVSAAKLLGTISDAQIADLAAAKITGTLDDDQIAELSASKILGTLVDAQIASVAAAKVTGTLTDAQIAALDAAKLTGDIIAARLQAVQFGGGNLFPDSSVEGGTVFTSINSTGSVSTEQVAHGEKSAKFVANNVSLAPYGYKPRVDSTNGPNENVRVRPGEKYTISAHFFPDSGEPRDVLLYAFWFKDDWSNSSHPNDTFTADDLPDGEWTRKGFTVTAPADAVWLAPSPRYQHYPAVGDVGYIDGIQVEIGEVMSAYAPRPDEILPSTITATEIADNAVTSAKIIAGAVVAGKIAANAVTATEIAANAVTASEIAAGAVTAGKIAADAVTATEIAANAVTASEIAADAVTAAKIEAGAVIAAKLAAGAVETDKLAALAVTAAKIDAGAVVAGKIAADAVTATEIAANAVTASEIAAGAVIAAKIAAGAVETDKLAALSVTSAKIDALAVVAGKIAANAVTATTIAAGAVTTPKLDAYAVTAGKIAADAITATEIAAGAVTASELAADSVTAVKIAAGAVETDKLDAEAVTAEKIAAENVTADKIAANAVTADKLEAVLLLASQIKTAEEGQRVEIDTDGVRLVASNGATLVNLPTAEGNPAIFGGDIVASALEVLGDSLLRGESKIAESGALGLEASLADPKIAPTVSVDPERLGLGLTGMVGLDHVTNGGAVGSTAVFLTTREVGGRAFVYERLASTGAASRSADVASGSPMGVTQLTVAGSRKIFLLTRSVLGGTYTYYLWRLNASTLSVDAFFDVTSIVPNGSSDVSGWAGLGNDGTNLLLVTYNTGSTTGQAKVQKVSGADGSTVGGALVLTGRNYTRDSGYLRQRFSSIELVGGKYVVSINLDPTHGTAQEQFDATSGAYEANARFRASTSFYCLGVAHDGTRFWSIDGSTQLVKHSDWTWTTESPIFWFAYSWFDDTGSKQTKVSPIATLDATDMRRSRFKITVPVFPAGIERAKLYVYRNPTEPATTSLKLQAPSTYVDTDTATVAHLLDYNGAGAAPPAASTFGAGTPATIMPSGATGYTNGFRLRGDGEMRLPVVTTAQRDALAASVGDAVFNSTNGCVEAYDGTRWTNGSSGFKRAAISANTALSFNAIAAGAKAEVAITEAGWYDIDIVADLQMTAAGTVALVYAAVNTTGALGNGAVGSSAVFAPPAATARWTVPGGGARQWLNVGDVVGIYAYKIINAGTINVIAGNSYVIARKAA